MTSLPHLAAGIGAGVCLGYLWGRRRPAAKPRRRAAAKPSARTAPRKKRRWTPPLLLGSVGGGMVQIPLHSSQVSLISFDLEFLSGLIRDWGAKLF